MIIEVITDFRKKMDYHLYFDKVAKGDLMQKAILYAYILGTIVPLSQ